MNFDLTDEQRLLAESLNRFVTERYGFEERLHARQEPDGFGRETWRSLADLGIIGLPFAEEDGGFGGGGVETMLVMEALGRGLLLEPYLTTAILAGSALRHAATPVQKKERIGAIIAGDHIMSLAHFEPGGHRFTLDCLSTRAEPTSAGWRLSGAKTAVTAGASADELVVSARTPNGVSLFLVSPRETGVQTTRRTGYDGVALADVIFEGVALANDALLGCEGGGATTLARVFEEASAAVAAEAVGIMGALLDMTLEYLKTRTQFGVPIGSFQALQHRAVDMLIEVELARSMAMLAAISITRPAEERARNIAAAKAKIGRASRFVGQQAVQLHGAIGLTMEYKVGHAFKRLTAIDALFGDADHHLEMLAEAGGLLPLG
jgi:alkylation response protein AidB-like acyl-CoA dehydrogenase